MSDKKVMKPIALAVGAALAGSFAISGVVHADGLDNPFEMSSLSIGYMLGDAEGSCGGDKAEGEGSCGEGSCGDDKKGEGDDKAGEGSCGEGSCGADKDAEGSCGDDKKGDAEGSCGEGSCGSSI